MVLKNKNVKRAFTLKYQVDCFVFSVIFNVLNFIFIDASSIMAVASITGNLQVRSANGELEDSLVVQLLDKAENLEAALQ